MDVQPLFMPDMLPKTNKPGKEWAKFIYFRSKAFFSIHT